MNSLTRRDALRAGAGLIAGLGLAPAFWRVGRRTATAQVRPAQGPYGPLQPADLNGIMLPKGFRSRVIAHGRQPVAGTGYVWHDFSDGAATFATSDGGWILVSNSETGRDLGGGASAIRFDARGQVVDAYRILSGTTANCAGGRTPWGTWLSCEETSTGQVWECDPTGSRPAVARPAMGVFSHEAAAVDPEGHAVYLTEDQGDGGFYRFRARSYPDLSEGTLEVAVVEGDGRVRWVRVPDPLGGAGNPTRKQVPEMTQFKRGEGIYFDAGIVYVATTSDSKLHAYDTRTARLKVIYDRAALQDPPLVTLDNVTVSRSGDIFVCEDSGEDDPLDLGIITPEGEVARFLKVTGPQHGGGDDLISEVTGPVFDPSGTRLYFSSQRAYANGQIYEITGPFRQRRPPGAAVGRPVQGAGLGLEVPRRLSRSDLVSRGLPVALTLESAAPVTITARVTVRSQGRSRSVTLARFSRRVDAGPERLRLRLSRSARRRLRGRRFTRVVVEVAVGQGAARQRARRTVRVTSSGS